MRFRARVAGLEPGFVAAAELFRKIGFPLYLAVVQLEHAELLAASGGSEGCAPLLAEAREILGRLGAAPWLARVDALGIGAMTTA